MKRMMIATALVTTIGTAGLAATEAQIRQVQNFDQSIDTSSFSDEQYDIAYGIVTSGDSYSENVAKLRAIAAENEMNQGLAMITEAERNRLLSFAPDADLTNVTQGQVETALSATYGSDSHSEVTRRVQNILSGDDTNPIVVGSNVENLLQSYVPGADVSVLTEDELALAMGYINSDMNRTEVADRLQELFN